MLISCLFEAVFLVEEQDEIIAANNNSKMLNDVFFNPE